MNMKVASRTTDHKVFFIRTIQPSGGSCVAVEKHSPIEFSVCVPPSRITMYRIVKQF
jgi:hypothetical protein